MDVAEFANMRQVILNTLEEELGELIRQGGANGQEAFQKALTQVAHRSDLLLMRDFYERFWPMFPESERWRLTYVANSANPGDATRKPAPVRASDMPWRRGKRMGGQVVRAIGVAVGIIGIAIYLILELTSASLSL